ncbi:MAG TPA: hypothetical protein GX519_06025 [Thermoanaerobacterales bacterium]|nr:hypothetical protein [Thermoanaerobacterales bacterium]
MDDLFRDIKNLKCQTAYNSRSLKRVVNSVGQPDGVASLDGSGKVPASQLPSYVDDVIEGYFNTVDSKFYIEDTYVTEILGETGKIYVSLDTNKLYRWSGSAFIYITRGAVDSVNGETGLVDLKHYTCDDLVTLTNLLANKTGNILIELTKDIVLPTTTFTINENLENIWIRNYDFNISHLGGTQIIFSASNNCTISILSGISLSGMGICTIKLDSVGFSMILRLRCFEAYTSSFTKTAGTTGTVLIEYASGYRLPYGESLDNFELNSTWLNPGIKTINSESILGAGNIDLVKGPASATDNAIARFDGTTGKLVQNSGAYIDDDGNVGIGTETPVGKLDVSGGVIYARNGLADTDKEQIRIGRSDNDSWYHSIHSYHASSGAKNYLKFRVHNGGPAPFYMQNDVMTMLGNGHVGIGEDEPSESLDVLGNIKASGAFKIRDTEFKENYISLVTGTYNEIDILKFGRTKTLQHSISSTQDTTGGGTNAIRFNVWNNLNAKVKVLDLNVGYGGTSGTATINGDIVVSGTVNGRDVSVDGEKLDTTVVGPASSTDNAIARFDGVTGKLVQNGPATLDDDGNIAGLKDTSTKTVTIDSAVQMSYDPATETLEFNFI